MKHNPDFYDYSKYCPPQYIKAKRLIGLIIYAGVVTSVYALASTYL